MAVVNICTPLQTKWQTCATTVSFKKLLQKSELSKYHINYVCRAVTSDSYSRKILAGSVKTSWSKLVRRTGEIVVYRGLEACTYIVVDRHTYVGRIDR